MSGAPTVFIEFSGDVALAIEDIWPDGDAPEEITPEVVAELMRQAGSKMNVLREWALTSELVVRVACDHSHAVEVWP